MFLLVNLRFSSLFTTLGMAYSVWCNTPTLTLESNKIFISCNYWNILFYLYDNCIFYLLLFCLFVDKMPLKGTTTKYFKSLWLQEPLSSLLTCVDILIVWSMRKIIWHMGSGHSDKIRITRFPGNSQHFSVTHDKSSMQMSIHGQCSILFLGNKLSNNIWFNM